MPRPPSLPRIIAQYESLGEEARRAHLVAHAEQAARHEPRPGETFDLEDVRKDEECTDTVGIYLKLDRARRVTLRIALGPRVQTLTKAMAAILCEGLEGLTPEEILELPSDFVPKIAGRQLTRIRAQTVFYVLTRITGACKALLRRRRADDQKS